MSKYFKSSKYSGIKKQDDSYLGYIYGTDIKYKTLPYYQYCRLIDENKELKKFEEMANLYKTRFNELYDKYIELEKEIGYTTGVVNALKKLYEDKTNEELFITELSIYSRKKEDKENDCIRE